MKKITAVALAVSIFANIYFAYELHVTNEKLQLAKVLFEDVQDGHILSNQIWLRTLIDLEELRMTKPTEARGVSSSIICDYGDEIESFMEIESLSAAAIESLKLSKAKLEVYCATNNPL